MERKHIAMYIGSLRKGGAERVMCNLAEYMYSAGYRVTLVTTYLSDDEYSVKNSTWKRCDYNEKGDNVVEVLNPEEKIKYVCDYLVKTLEVTDTVIILDDDREFSFLNDARQLTIQDIKEINSFFKNESFVNPTNLKVYKDASKYFADSLGDSRVQAICGTRVCVGNKKYVYVYIHDDRIRRIWQENEMATLAYAGKVCAMLVLMNRIKEA